MTAFRKDRLDLLAVQGTLKSLLQHHSSKASILCLHNLRLTQFCTPPTPTCHLSWFYFPTHLPWVSCPSSWEAFLVSASPVCALLPSWHISIILIRREKWNILCSIKWGSSSRRFPGGLVVKNPPANAGDVGSNHGSRRFPGEGNGNPLQYSCLGNPMDRGDW